jgi:hypothetical protein
MLNKRIVGSAIVLALSLPSLSQAAPLTWAPGTAVLARISQWLDLVPGKRTPTTRSVRHARKNGCGMDPNGATLCGGGD